MQDNCRNCLAQEVCDITGGVCQKMDTLFAQRKSVTNGRTTMTNSSNSGKNSATPKIVDGNGKVMDIVENSIPDKQPLPTSEPTVPAQATTPKTGTNFDKIVDHNNKTLFAGTSDEIVGWLNEHAPMIYVIRPADHPDLVTSIDYLKKHAEKLSLVQRIKSATEKLAKNRKAMLFLGGAAAVAGLAIKNNRRKAVSVESLDEAEGPIEGVDDGIATDDSN